MVPFNPIFFPQGWYFMVMDYPPVSHFYIFPVFSVNLLPQTIALFKKTVIRDYFFEELSEFSLWVLGRIPQREKNYYSISIRDTQDLFYAPLVKSSNPAASKSFFNSNQSHMINGYGNVDGMSRDSTRHDILRIKRHCHKDYRSSADERMGSGL